MDIKAVIEDDEMQAVLKAHIEKASKRFVVGKIVIARANPPQFAGQPPAPMMHPGQEYFSASCVLSETAPAPEPAIAAVPAPAPLPRP